MTYTPPNKIAQFTKAQNILVNGGMEVWQRGTDFNPPANNDYTADKWQISFDGSPTVRVRRDSTTIDSELYSNRLSITATGTSSYCYVYQSVENGSRYAGKTVTIKVRMNSNVSGPDVRINDGVGQTVSSAHSGSGWETLTITRTLDSSATQLRVDIGFVSNTPSVSEIYIDSVMLVLGDEVIDYVIEDPAVELMRCQRYYEEGSVYITAIPLRQEPSVTRSRGVPVHMRGVKSSIPTVTVTTVSASLFQDNTVGSGELSDTSNWTFGATNITASDFQGGTGDRSSQNNSYDNLALRFTWEAEV